MNRVLITGATGLTGRYVLEQALARYPQARFYCTQRADSPSPRLLDERVEYLACDVADAADLARTVAALGPLDEVVHIVQLRYAPLLIEALAQGPTRPRLTVVGTTGVFSRFQRYSAEYQQAEALLAERYPHHVLLRPTMIYGDPRDKNLHKLIRFVDRYGCFPRFGAGAGKLQPIHYQDLGDAILAVLDRPALSGRAYTLSGGSVVSYAELLALVGSLLGRPCRQLPVPIPFGRLAGRIAERVFAALGRETPLREEQVLRLLEDKHFDHSEATRDLGFAPRTLESGLREEMAVMGLGARLAPAVERARP